MSDIIEYRGKHKGYSFIIRQTSCSGYRAKTWRCGYVKIPRTHALFEKDDSYWLTGPVDCHGGVTFSGSFKKIRGYWIGFDTAHSFDTDNPKSKDYCIAECKHIIEQLTLSYRRAIR